MPQFSELLSSIVPTFGVVAVGWLCRRINIWDKKAVAVLNSYAYYIALPALIFQSLISSDLGSHLSLADLKLVGGTLAAHIIIFFIAMAVAMHKKVPRGMRAVAPMLLTFGSTAYLGIPYVTNTFGPTATSYAAIISVTLVVTMLFLSIFSIQRATGEAKTGLLRQFVELPFLYAVVIGLVVGFAGWVLPHFLTKTLNVFSGSASSTALLALGAFDYDFRLNKIKLAPAILFGFGKVFITGTATFIVLKLIGVTGMLLAVGTAMGAVSIAITAFVLAEQHDVAREYTDASIAVSGTAAFLALTTISYLWLSTGVFG